MNVIGLTDLVSDLMRAASTVKPRSEAATKAAAEALADDARSFAPVLTGALRDSIEVTQDDAEVEVGPTVEYGGFVEFGTSIMSPQPYLQPAADKQEPEFVKALEDIAGDV